MRTKLILALMSALLAFFGAMAVAEAAAPATSASARGSAQPGTYAAFHGAPFCDDRAASSYAAEPTPAPAPDGGTIAARTEGCRVQLSLKAFLAGSSHGDDLQRTAPTARTTAIVPTLAVIGGPSSIVGDLDPAPADGARDGYGHADSPPPRPIPWIRS